MGAEKVGRELSIGMEDGAGMGRVDCSRARCADIDTPSNSGAFPTKPGRNTLDARVRCIIVKGR